ncbi:MAG: type II toxin-antitoxin system YafQ family toxin [Pyrinomonadaceae bacterium]
MRKISITTQFKRDTKRVKKSGKDVEELKAVIAKLAAGENLEDKYRDHALTGSYRQTRECHLEPDWLLIYKCTKDELILIRTGSHSELFQ